MFSFYFSFVDTIIFERYFADDDASDWLSRFMPLFVMALAAAALLMFLRAASFFCCFAFRASHAATTLSSPAAIDIAF
jgi:hypothetical protein